MYVNSRFLEIMKLFPKERLQEAVTRREGDKWVKKFSCYNQLIAMLYGQISGASSLRVLTEGYNQHPHMHYHLRTGELKRSTLSDANAERDPAIFLEVAEHMMQAVGRSLRGEIKTLTRIIDSTPIMLKGRGFDDWAQATKTRHTQGLKLHLGYDLETGVPSHCEFSAANVNDINVSRQWPVEEGRMYVFDKGYCDYDWWWKLSRAGASFVTRLKKNAAVRVIKENVVSGEGIIADEAIVLKNKHPRAGKQNPYSEPLRRIVIARQDKETPLILITNRMDLPASEIAELYRKRWRIELLFKWIKQHLKIKKFLGTNENAVKIQIVIALIAYMLLAMYHRMKHETASLYSFLTIVRATLFQPDRIHSYKQKIKNNMIKEKQLEFCYA